MYSKLCYVVLYYNGNIIKIIIKIILTNNLYYNGNIIRIIIKIILYYNNIVMLYRNITYPRFSINHRSITETLRHLPPNRYHCNGSLILNNNRM